MEKVWNLKQIPYFYKGKPKTEKVTVEIVNSQTIVSALKAGKYDIAYQIPTDLYKTFKDLDNSSNTWKTGTVLFIYGIQGRKI